MTAARPDSARKRQLLDAAYDYVIEHGLTELSLRPLAEAIGSSPRVLLYLFGSKDDLVQALLARARSDELAMLSDVDTGGGLTEVGQRVWRWLTHPDHRRLLTLWAEGYTRSLVHPAGPWADFAQRTVNGTGWIFSPPHSPRGCVAPLGGPPSGPSCSPCFVARSSTCLPPVTWRAPPPQCTRT